MVVEALPLAFAAGVYPLGLALVLRYLGGPQPYRLALLYLAGAATVTALAGTAILLALDGTGLTARRHPAPSAGLQITLGVALLAVAAQLARRRSAATERKHEPRQPSGPHPGVLRVFLFGAVTYIPSILYVGAVKKIADAPAGSTAVAVTMLVCVVLVLEMVALPIVARAVAPRRAEIILAAYNGWVQRHGRDLLLLASLAGGVYLIVDGIVTILG